MRWNRVGLVALGLLPLAYPVLGDLTSPRGVAARSVAVSPTSEVYDTAQRFRRRDGTFDRLRTETVHRPIIRQWLARGQASAHPVVYLMLGPPGSGKSWLIPHLVARGVLDREHYLEVDPDQIQNAIPEYARLRQRAPREADTLVHEESGYLRDQIVESAMRQKMSLIRQGTLAHPDEAIQLVKDLRRWGPSYQIRAIYVSASLPTILARVKQRGAKTGRIVPDATVYRKFRDSRESLEAIRGLVDEVLIVDNDETPILREHYRHGKIVFDSYPMLR